MSLVGEWQLESLVDVTNDRELGYPYGKNPVGFLIITKSGLWSAVLMNSDRGSLTTQSKWNSTMKEKAIAADTYSSYCGPYDVKGTEITIHVKASLFPDWTGKDLQRIYSLNGDTLTIETYLNKGNSVTHNRVKWKRISSQT